MTAYMLEQANSLPQPKQIFAVELATEYLAVIAARNPAISGHATVDQDKTLVETKAADTRTAANNTTASTGVPVAYKDILCQIGWHSIYSPKMLDSFVSPCTAAVVQNLSGAGMVTLDRTGMDEFVMGSTNETSFYGATKSPWGLEHIPGGLSDGSTVVIAARLVPAALGSDTGGSIRQPALHCNIAGIKPIYGMALCFGMAARTSSFDQVDPMARVVRDCAILLNAMTSFDECDSTSLERDKGDHTRDLDKPLEGLKIGLPKECFGEDADTDAQTAPQDVIDLSKTQGAETAKASLPQISLSIPVYYVLASAEASTNLSRSDGVRYGHRVTQFGDSEEMYSNIRTKGFGSEVKCRIMTGTYVLSHDYYDAYYLKAQRLRRPVANDFQMTFGQCDLILAPTTPTVAPKPGSNIHDSMQMYLFDIHTTAVNPAGLSALTLFAGFSADGLSIGARFIGNYFFGARTSGAVHQIQLNSDWHTKAPE